MIIYEAVIYVKKHKKTHTLILLSVARRVKYHSLLVADLQERTESRGAVRHQRGLRRLGIPGLRRNRHVREARAFPVELGRLDPRVARARGARARLGPLAGLRCARAARRVGIPRTLRAYMLGADFRPPFLLPWGQQAALMRSAAIQ